MIYQEILQEGRQEGKQTGITKDKLVGEQSLVLRQLTRRIGDASLDLSADSIPIPGSTRSPG